MLRASSPRPLRVRTRPGRETATRRGQHQAADLAAPAAVQALMNRIVLAVDRQDRDTLPRRGLGDDAAGHHEDFPCWRARSSGRARRREDSFERLGAARGAQHEVHIRMRCDGDESVAAAPRNRHVRGEPDLLERSIAAPVAIAATRGRYCAIWARDARFSPAARRRSAADRNARRPRRARSARSSRWTEDGDALHDAGNAKALVARRSLKASRSTCVGTVQPRAPCDWRASLQASRPASSAAKCT